MRKSRCSRRTTCLIVACLAANAWSTEPAVPPKVSTFAPAADLAGQVDFYIGRLDEALAEPDKFDGAKQSRVWKDANTLAALALMLAVYDEPHSLQGAMPGVLRGAQALAAAENRVERAQDALAKIKAARAGEMKSDEAVRWEKVASLPALMKQVPLVHAGLGRGVQPARLKRLASQSQGQAATLAAIAQAAMLDDEYAASPEEAARWSEYCAQMRDAAGEVNAAVAAADAVRVEAAMKRMTESCEACHAKFRQQ